MTDRSWMKLSRSWQSLAWLVENLTCRVLCLRDNTRQTLQRETMQKRLSGGTPALSHEVPFFGHQSTVLARLYYLSRRKQVRGDRP